MLKALVTWCLWKSLSTSSQILTGMDATQVSRQVAGHKQLRPAAADRLALREVVAVMQSVPADHLQSTTFGHSADLARCCR